MQEPATPEHDKFALVREDANLIGDFIEWLQNDQQVKLMLYGDVPVEHPCSLRDMDDMGWARGGEDVCVDGHLWTRSYSGTLKEDLGVCPKCAGEGYYQTTKDDLYLYAKSIPSILATYFGIDEKAYQAETDAVYAVVSEMARAAQEKK